MLFSASLLLKMSLFIPLRVLLPRSYVGDKLVDVTCISGTVSHVIDVYTERIAKLSL